MWGGWVPPTLGSPAPRAIPKAGATGGCRGDLGLSINVSSPASLYPSQKLGAVGHRAVCCKAQSSVGFSAPPSPQAMGWSLGERKPGDGAWSPLPGRASAPWPPAAWKPSVRWRTRLQSPMHVLLQPNAHSPDAHPPAARWMFFYCPMHVPLQPDACPPHRPAHQQAPRCASVLRQPVSAARLLALCAARYIAGPVKIISACACVVCSRAPA